MDSILRIHCIVGFCVWVVASVAALDPPETAAAVSNRELPPIDRGSNNLGWRLTLSDSSRGGYMTMSAPMTVTSLPFRTSSVKRGAWMLETVFNRPPT